MTDEIESPETGEVEQQQEPQSGIQKLHSLFNEEAETPEEGAGETQQNATTEGGKPKGKPAALKDLAETLSLKPEDLYSIAVPMADGKSMTLGELKDAAAKQDDLSVRELEFAERVSKQEAEWVRSQQEMQTLLSQIDPKGIKPEVRDQIRQKIEAGLKHEREMVMKTIPEWQNETVREAELAGMVDHLKDFGIAESFLTATMSHKLFRFVRDAYLRKARIDKALAQVQTVKKPSTTGKSGAGNGAARAPATTKTRKGTSRDRLLSVLQ